MSKIQRMRAVLNGVVATALAAAALPVLATTASAATDPLSGQAGPVTISPTEASDSDAPTPPAGTTLSDFLKHPVLSWQPITTLPVAQYRVQISPNAEFTNNKVTLPNGGLTVATQYDLPNTLPYGSYYWRVRGEDAAGHATVWTGAAENDSTSHWQFTKSWNTPPTGLSPAYGSTGVTGRTFSWNPVQDASAYKFVLSTSSQFLTTSAATTWACTTNHTKITPFMNDPDGGVAGLPDNPVIGAPCGDTDKLMQDLQKAKTWYWKVQAIDGTVAEPTPADGSGTCFADGSNCTPWTPVQMVSFAAQSNPAPVDPDAPLATPANATSSCTSVLAGGQGIPLCYDTPTLSWSPVSGANAYVVIVSTESVIVRSYYTFDNSFTPRDSYFDNQAGHSYRWDVQACFYTPGATSFNMTNCGDAATALFHKASAPLPTAAAGSADTPGHNGLYVTTDNNQSFATATRQVKSQQLTFHWDGLLASTTQMGTQSRQEAKSYRLQYTTDGNWLTATTVNTDGTHWTDRDGFLPDGGYSWRVAPLDGSDNVLAWSTPQTFAKGTVAPTVTIGQTGVLAPTSAVNLVFATPVTGVTVASLGIKDVGGNHIAGTLVYPSTGPTTATFKPTKPLLPGERIEPWVTSAVQDLTGNSAKVGPGTSLVNPTVDSADPTIHEAWAKMSTSHASGASYAKAAGVGDTIAFKFTGSAVSLYGIRTADAGYATVLIDGVPRKTVNFYSHTTAYGVNLYSVLLNEGAHTLTVQVKGSHPSGSKGNAVNVDAIKVDGSLMQQTSAVQAWSRHRSTDAVKGSYDAEASYLATWKASRPTVSTSFRGTAVHVVGCKSPDAGLLAVYVDGKLKATVDGYQSYSSCNKTLVHVTGLTNAAHSIIVAPLGTHDSKATGSKVSVDAIVAS